MTFLADAAASLGQATMLDALGDGDAAHAYLDRALLALARDLARPGPQNRGRQTQLARELVEQWEKGRRWTA